MRFSRRLFFNFAYLRRPRWDTGVSPPELMTFIAHHPPGRALDLGCGTGTNVITLARHGWSVTGVDFARRAIQLARHKIARAGIRADLRVGDITRLDGMGGSFDLILDIGCFHGLSQAEKSIYLDNLERLLAGSGTFLLYGFFREKDSAGPGMLAADVTAIQDRLEMISRQDGLERGKRPSAWFSFRKSQRLAEPGLNPMSLP